MRFDYPDWRGANLIKWRNSADEQFSSENDELIISPLFYLTTTLGEPVISRRFSGALIEKTTDQNITQDTFTAVSWDDNVIYDTDGYWSSGAPTRFTVPDGIFAVKLASNIIWNDFAGAGSYTVHRILKNDSGGTGADNTAKVARKPSTTNLALCPSNGSTTVIHVQPGDYFELWVNQGAVDDGAGHDISPFDRRTWFSIQAIA